jgi:hypothetical protein
MLLASSRSESLRRRGAWKRRRSSIGGPWKSGSVNWNLLISDRWLICSTQVGMSTNRLRAV